jgi:hypothetical protein
LTIDTGGRRIVEYPRVNVKPQVMFWRMMFEDRLVERPAVVPDNPLKPTRKSLILT